MSYAVQRYLAIAVAVILAGLAVVQAANPVDFGLTPVWVRWIGAVGAMLGVLAGFLPSVRGMSQDPEFLIHRISELPTYQRQLIASELADRAGRTSANADPLDVLLAIETMSPDDLAAVRDAAMTRHQTLVSKPPRFLDDAEHPPSHDVVTGTPPLPPASGGGGR